MQTWSFVKYINRIVFLYRLPYNSITITYYKKSPTASLDFRLQPPTEVDAQLSVQRLEGDKNKWTASQSRRAEQSSGLGMLLLGWTRGRPVPETALCDITMSQTMGCIDRLETTLLLEQGLRVFEVIWDVKIKISTYWLAMRLKQIHNFKPVIFFFVYFFFF